MVLQRLLLLLVALWFSMGAATADQKLSLRLQLFAKDFVEPLFLASAPDEQDLYLVEQGGKIWRLSADGSREAKPFADLSKLLTTRGGEQGLLGLAFHPDYARNRTLFVYYTATDDKNTLARLTSRDGQVDMTSLEVLLAVEDPASNHNGGMLAFGPDGYLSVGLGDGGGGGDPWRTAQDLNSLLGKLLRLDVDGKRGYRIPKDNPFVGQSGKRAEIWAYGLRNPWRFSFDRETGDLYLADVGQNRVEEVDYLKAGSAGGVNFGWSVMEGSHCFRPKQGCDRAGLTEPVIVYDHDNGCSITGGYVYRGAAIKALQGSYLYSDYCSGALWAARAAEGFAARKLLDSGANISSFGEDNQGELYLLDHRAGKIYRLVVDE